MRRLARGCRHGLPRVQARLLRNKSSDHHRKVALEEQPLGRHHRKVPRGELAAAVDGTDGELLDVLGRRDVRRKREEFMACLMPAILFLLLLHRVRNEASALFLSLLCRSNTNTLACPLG